MRRSTAKFRASVCAHSWQSTSTACGRADWPQMIDGQAKFLAMVLNFTKDPSRKALRPPIELYGRIRGRMKVEVEILARQLQEPAGPLLRAR